MFMKISFIILSCIVIFILLRIKGGTGSKARKENFVPVNDRVKAPGPEGKMHPGLKG